ncbi:carboxylesterase [Obba rivulosa]|uniref:Carboxylesterase n=1 Tax=Obba rivulosa TaxID=1052685 RepID=A0A8E2AMU9_9APHY|nr:carboxylesterase [Obba rivulosa]
MIAKASQDADEPVVPHSDLRTTFSGIVHPVSTPEAPVHQYRGIKYATIPARFRQSRLNTTYLPQTDASRYGAICPQADFKSVEADLYGISDDGIPKQIFKQNEFECLNLNITCPGNAPPDAGLPVMLWIHGGGNRGSGSSWLFDGGSFVQKSMQLEKPVILVTFNYRLGLLGCAASPALRDDNKAAGDEGVGNYGLRDQQRAIEWVHRFIPAFGGDAANITLFGAGTGAADVLCHLYSASNATHPRIARAIIQSVLPAPEVPTVPAAGSMLSRTMAAVRAFNVAELRDLPIDVLVKCAAPCHVVDDGVFFRKGFGGTIVPEHDHSHHLHTEAPELRAFAHRHMHSASRSPSPIRGRSRSRPAHAHHSHSHPHPIQPLLIGDCADESDPWALPAALWTASGLVRRIRAVCQSLSLSNALMRAYDIAPHTPAGELAAHIRDLVTDTRVAYPTECVVRAARRERGGKGVWRYVFDQEGPGRGVPHHEVDIVYLFDNVPLPEQVQTPPAEFSDRFYDSDDDDAVDFSRLRNYPRSPDSDTDSGVDDNDKNLGLCMARFSHTPNADNADSDSDAADSGFGGESDPFASCSLDATASPLWAYPTVDAYTYTRIRDAVQRAWITFAYGGAPWNEERVCVFGPEGEVGERSEAIFEGRRRVGKWKEALEPLGMHLVGKLGAELGNGPSGRARY